MFSELVFICLAFFRSICLTLDARRPVRKRNCLRVEQISAIQFLKLFFEKTQETNAIQMREEMLLIGLISILSVAYGTEEHRTSKKIETSEPLSNFPAHSSDEVRKFESNVTLEEQDLPAALQDTEGAASVPVAEKFIGHRRTEDRNSIREKMIGMIFTGQPRPLDSERRRPQRRPIRRQKPRPDVQARFDDDDNMPAEILRPIAFIPEAGNVEFPAPHLNTAQAEVQIIRHPSRRERPRRPRPPFEERRRPRDPSVQRRVRPGRRPQRESEDFFSNTVGSDFGPVTYESFDVHGNGHSPQKPHIRKPHPGVTSSKNPPASGFSTTNFGHSGGSSFGTKFNTPKFSSSFDSNPPFSSGGRCQQYTEDICLDADNYPHQEILSSLATDPGRANTLMAEVRAESLVSARYSDQERQHDSSHKFTAKRRQDSSNSLQTDFFEDGGYLCPSEVKYARPKRARNSKGAWKFVVNMDKYTQTIRMEKCMKAGGTCSYVSHHYYATCNQIYNYQRLLSWEKDKGLHMDIFKVPSCCSCHIHGYAYVFPPLNKNRRMDTESRASENAPSLKPENSQPINEEAPPYSPINYPNIKVSEAPIGRSRPRNTSRKPIERRKDTKRITDSTTENTGNQFSKRINYGYHPIIDFFQ